MNTTFFVQNNFVERATAKVARFAREHGISLEDRSCTAELEVDKCGIDWRRYDVVLPYGSAEFLREIKRSSISRFVLHDESRFAVSNWTPIFSERALNFHGRCVPAEEVDPLLATGPLHVRPDIMHKAFTGGVFDVDRWDMQLAERRLPRDLACFVSQVRPISTEWRCWVIDRQVIEISKYREAGKMAEHRELDQDVWHEAQKLAERYLPAPTVVMDVARLDEDSGILLIEFNPIHSSGWYAADVKTVLLAWVAWSKRQAWH